MMPFHHAAGSHVDQGHALGRQQRAHIAAFLGDGLCRLQYLVDDCPSLDALQGAIAAHGEAIAAASPSMYQLVAGLAAGAGITVDQALLMQLRREIAAYRAVPARGECTSFAVRLDGLVWGAQTVDLDGCLADQMCVVRYAGADGRRILMLTYTGLLGFLGINSDGLGIMINLVVGGAWAPGLPPYLAVRALLEESTLDAALAAARRYPFASSRSLTLFDATRHVTLEACGAEKIAVQRPWALHTNHFLADAFVPGDALNMFAKNDSRRRFQAAESLLAAAACSGPDDLFAILSSHGTARGHGALCVHGEDGAYRTDRTVAAVAMDVAGGRLHVRAGNPCSAATTVYALDG